MIEREYNISDPSKSLAEILGANRQGYQGFRRRAVLSRSSDTWSLLCCTVEAIAADLEPEMHRSSRQYQQVVMFEDWPTEQDCLDFVAQLKEGRGYFDKFSIETADTHRHWQRERVPLSNNYMARAGYVLSMRFDSSRKSRIYGALLAPDQPYYPDLAEAARDWLPFPVYHGDSDSRNGEIVFLLPETRAYFSDTIPKGDVLHVSVAGTEVDRLSLSVKGAWWENRTINHFDADVIRGHAELHIPEAAERLEFVLMDSSGTVYDHQSESDFRHTGLGRKRLRDTNASLAGLVQDACRDGEGSKVEFKPFIEIDGGSKRTKLSEVMQTVAVFANAQGGRIFLGIDDDCGLTGINEAVARWANAAADEATVERYLGALRGKVRDVIIGDPTIRFLQTVIDGQYVAVIEVEEAKERPVYLHQDNNLYIRRGASNKKATPGELKDILCVERSELF